MSDDRLGGGLPDLGGVSLSDLRDQIDEPTKRTALDMILSDQDQASSNGFNNYISNHGLDQYTRRDPSTSEGVIGY